MAYRTVYGHTHSENGWPMVDQGSCEWVRIPGAEHVSLQIQKGQPLAILRAFVADWHAYIEPIRDADSACWTPTNSVASSNHLSGTACDVNWNSHPFKIHNAGFNAQQIATMREMLAFYEDTVFWGNDWQNPRDAMHVQCGYNTHNNPHTQDFINRKIRADGFSTFRRSGTPPSPPPAPNAQDVLTRAMGGRLSITRYAELLPAVAASLRACDCTNVNRIAMWCAQIGHESGGLFYTEEIASGAAYEGRGDLGNTQPGDGVRFKGRSWIQITGRHNYTKLSQWAHSKGLVPSPSFFVDHPTELASDRYAGLGAAWYWVVARPDINALSDRRDLETVTRRINGGLNGIEDRRTRYQRALAMGDQLLALIGTTPGDDELSAEAERKIDVIYRELTQRHPSRSPFRHVGEGPIDTWAGIDLNNDAHGHVSRVIEQAKLGHPGTLALLREVAEADPQKYPDRQDDALLAQAVLASLDDQPESRPITISNSVDTRELDKARAEAAQLRDENTRLRAEVDGLRQQLETPHTALAPLESGGTTGELIGRAYDALQELRLADALPIEERAPLAALISVLQTKNGSDIK